MLIHKIVQPIVVTTGWRPTQNWSNLKLRGAKCGLFSNKKFFTFQFMTFINRNFHLLYAFFYLTCIIFVNWMGLKMK